MPTGGVSIDNAADWLRAGAVAVGIGSALVDAAAVKSGDFASMTRKAERLVANLNESRLRSA
jgi:2-dehydro-3-deoxyphosphogluconate aldolase/(4S)-4-hydroxy-2-oxoglutarate aldolase